MSLRPDRQQCAALALRVHRFLCAAERVLLRASQDRSRHFSVKPAVRNSQSCRT